MICLGRKNIVATIAFVLSIASVMPCLAQLGEADKAATRAELAALYRPLVNHIYEDLKMKLTRAERRELDNAPLFLTLDEHPRAIFAVTQPRSKRRITMSVGTAIVLRMEIVAFIVPEHLLEPETPSWFQKYCMLVRKRNLKFADTGIGRDVPHPLKVMGLSPDSIDEAVSNQIQVFFESGLYYMLGHEMGHLIHNDKFLPRSGESKSDWESRRRRQEAAADSFAIDLMIRLRRPPIGALITFLAWMLESDNIEGLPVQRTHPITRRRFGIIAESILADIDRFKIPEGDRASLVEVCLLLRKLNELADSYPDMFREMDEAARHTNIANLRRR